MTQIFLPHPDIAESARVLDNRRLISSIHEGYEAYIYLIGNPENKKLRHKHGHCVFRMYQGYESFLYDLLCIFRIEAECRGLMPMETPDLNSYESVFKITKKSHGDNWHPTAPPWFGCPTLHNLYKTHLSGKDFKYYAPKFKTVKSNVRLGYLAPDKKRKWRIYSNGWDIASTYLLTQMFEKELEVNNN